jgi:hypothetical protein
MQPVSNKDLPWTQMMFKFDVLGVARKFAKYVFTCQNKIKWENKI